MQNFKHFRLLILILVLLSISCSLFLPKPPRIPAPSGKIIYQTDQHGNYELYSYDFRTGANLRLTNNTSNESSPAYISSTNQIGFVSDLTFGLEFFVMDPLGKNTNKISFEDGVSVDYPAWSPDGKKIVASLIENCKNSTINCNFDIFSMDADGKNLKRLTETSASEWVPVWSPDGLNIAFASDRDGDSEIYVMDTDGANIVKLTDNKGYDGKPRWSPDGKSLSFETDREGGDWDIFVMNSDGSNPVQITTNKTNDYTQSWSPDGKWLVYASDMDGDSEIFIVDLNGQNQQRITRNSTNEYSPIWIPSVPIEEKENDS